MIDTGGVRASRFLKRNPDYIEAQGKAPAAAPEEPAPFRALIEGNRYILPAFCR